MKNNKKIILLNLVFFIPLILLSFLMGVWIKNESNLYNWDLVSLIVSNLVVIELFIITFILIDNRNLKKEINKEKIAARMIVLTYENCKKYIELLTTDIIKAYIIPKCDFKKTTLEKENLIFQNLKNAPFTYESQLLDFAKEGIITTEIFDDYIKLKNLYSSYVEIRLTFFDASELYTPLKEELEDFIRNKKEVL